MKKATWWLVASVLCLGGCLKVETHEEEGFVQISGGEVDVDETIRQLIGDWGWQHRGARVETASTSTSQTGLRVGTGEGLILPGQSSESHSTSWLTAKTNDGKSVEFEIQRGTDRPTTIHVRVEEGASVSTAQITADLSRRLQGKAHRNGAREPVTIRIDSLSRSTTEPNAYAGNWTAAGDWGYPAGHLRFEIRTEHEGSLHYDLFVEGGAPWKVPGGEKEGAVNFQLKQPAGVMTFEGSRTHDSGSGAVTFRPDAAYVSEMTKLLNARPDGDEAIRLFFQNIDLGYARQMKEAFGDELTLDRLVMLNNFHIPADYAKGIRQAGYKFSVDEIVRLNGFHIGLEMMRGFKQAGYDFSVDDLIRINGFHLSVADFTTFRDAGYKFSIDEMIRAKGFHIPVETARSLHEAGFSYSLDDLIRLNGFHVSPDYIIAFKRGGYSLSLDDVIRAQGFRINAEEAAALKGMGYNFSLDDLIRLRSFRVSVEFMKQVHDPQYENFTADELIDFQQRRVTADAINKIRAPKRN
jgi:hypothetical protein